MKNHEKRQRTQWVIILTALTMVAEIAAGYWTGSMALLADGWHMASHVGALSIAWLGYKLVDQPDFRTRYAFGGGKVLVLGGYTSAVVLLMTAVWMIAESIHRFLHPEALQAKEAMVVAVIGLVVNLVSALILEHKHDHGHGHDHDHCDHDHKPKHSLVMNPQAPKHEHKDLNMAGAYAHVIADALTSVLALVALALAYWKGWQWADPAVGILGAIMILRWGWGLFKESAHELLDGQNEDTAPVRQWLSEQGWQTSCLHMWKLDSQTLALHARLAQSEKPSRLDASTLRSRMKQKFHIQHLILEVADGAECELDDKHI
jgi:cation diffusion facilitator family transporter